MCDERTDTHAAATDQIEDGRVVLVVPSLRLIVMGRTLEEARAWARSAIGYRGLLTVRREVPMTGTNEVTRPPNSNAA